MPSPFYALTDEMIANHIADSFIGIYYLAVMQNESHTIKYVGRSDINLKRRLLQHAARGAYQFFSIEETETIFEAFQLECREWHRIEGLDNKIHPDAPSRLPYVCPYCGAGTEFETIT